MLTIRAATRALVATCALLLALCVGTASADENWTTPADALGARGDQHVDLPSHNAPADWSAPQLTAAAVGDVNGDGVEDFAAYAGGDVEVTFSQRPAPPVNVGFAIKNVGGFHGGLSSAGDVNGDGLDDIALLFQNGVTVVFGKREPTPVDLGTLGDGGFTINGLYSPWLGGPDNVNGKPAAVLLNDLNGDGVRDLLLRDFSNTASDFGSAAIVYPPRDAAGTTIDASKPGPHVSRFTASGDKQLDEANIGNLGDLDGDGRDDVMVAAEERKTTDQVAYGVLSPPPGSTIDLGTVADSGRGFEIRTHDGEVGWYGELENAITVGDENGDGKRDIAMDGFKMGSGVRHMRLAFTPPLGSKVDIDDVGATDSRGYLFHSYAYPVDVGDQSGDGRGDFAMYRYVYFTDPSKETGTREPVYSGFYFGLQEPNFAHIVSTLRDLNGDGKPELIIARSWTTQEPDGSQTTTYKVDVFDSARAPAIPVPDPPVVTPGGDVTVPVDLGTGAAGSGQTLAIHPVLEVDTGHGTAAVASDGGIRPSGGPRARLALTLSHAGPAGARPLAVGQTYKVRYSAGNGRGLSTSGPWREFVYRMPTQDTPTTLCPPRGKFVERRGTGGADRLKGTGCADRVRGFAGNDALDGRAGADVLLGDRGRDAITGGGGRDTIDAGAGDDRVYARDGQRDVVRCGRGLDRVRADGGDRLVGCEKITRR